MNKYEQVKEIFQKVCNYKDTIKWNAERSARIGRNGYKIRAEILCKKQLAILRESILLVKEVKQVKYIWDNRLAEFDKTLLYMYAVKNISGRAIAQNMGLNYRTTYRRLEAAIDMVLIYFNCKQNCHC